MLYTLKINNKKKKQNCKKSQKLVQAKANLIIVVAELIMTKLFLFTRQ